MKSNWQVDRFDNVIKTITPPVKLKSSAFLQAGNYPIVSQEVDLISGFWNNSEDVIKVTIPIVAFGDHTKTTKYIDFDFVQGADGLKIIQFDSLIYPKYGYYSILNSNIKDLGYARHFKLLKETIFAYPIEAKEQKRIVAILDAAFEKIDAVKQNAERNLQNAKELFQQALSEAMTPKEGWKSTTLKDECFIASSLVNPQEEKYRNLLHIGGGNIESNTGKLQNLLTAEQEKLVSGKFLFDSSVVLYNKIRPYLRKLARPDFLGLCSADMYPLTPQAKNSRDFLFFLLLSDNFTNYANKNSARAGMPKLNRESLFAYPFAIPDSIEQQGIADELDKLFDINQQIQTQYDTISADCDELKKAILTKAFAGEL